MSPPGKVIYVVTHEPVNSVTQKCKNSLDTHPLWGCEWVILPMNKAEDRDYQ